MYVEHTTRKAGGKQYECFMLRECYRESGKVIKRTIANISHLPAAEIKALQQALSTKQVGVPLSEIRTQTGKIIGGVIVVREILQKLGVSDALGTSRNARLCAWLIFSRLIEQGSRLSSSRLAERHDASLLNLENFDENDLYDALIWLSEQQELIQQSLFRGRYGNNTPKLFLYDVTSSYLEGTENELSWWGYNRDGKKGKQQIVFGLLTDQEGEPIAVEVFKGNTADSKTFLALVRDFGKRFSVKEVIFVGDRGMIKELGIEALHEESFRYITAITKPQIRTLLANGVIQLNLFDSELTEATDGEVRYILRRNDHRAKEMAASRQGKLERLQENAEHETQYLTQHLKASEEKAVARVAALVKKLKLEGLVKVEAIDRKVTVVADESKWEEAAQLDGCYVIKTDVPATELDTATVHERYKDLAKVEKGFRTIKTGLLEVRPIWLREEKKTRGHVFICMLAYMVARALQKLTVGEETVQDLLAELNRVSKMTMMVAGEIVSSVAQPPLRAAEILNQLGVKLNQAASIPTKRRPSKAV
jgi:transposase